MWLFVIILLVLAFMLGRSYGGWRVRWQMDEHLCELKAENAQLRRDNIRLQFKVNKVNLNDPPR